LIQVLSDLIQVEEAKMGQLIEYYIPAIFTPRQPRWIDLQQRGRILEFQKNGAKKFA
jgi:hypothetical protein